MNHDKLTTIVGAIGAAAAAVQPALAATQPGASLHSGDYAQLGFALCMALLGYFTNKGKQPA